MTAAARLQLWEGRAVEAWRRDWALPRLTVYASISSTSDVLREQALRDAPAGTVVLADHQTAGRGRLGRAWQTPPGRALLCSVLLRPEGGDADAAAALPLRIGLAVAEALERAAGVHAALKWPNDLLLGDAKVAGILCEAAAGFVVAGIGINVNQTAHELPAMLSPPATSLACISGGSTPRPAVAAALFDALRPLVRAPHRALSDAELRRFAARDALRGRSVTVDDRHAGTARGLDPRGALVLEQDGTLRLLHAGTVRSAP